MDNKCITQNYLTENDSTNITRIKPSINNTLFLTFIDNKTKTKKRNNISTNLFRNYALQKSISMNTSDDSKISSFKNEGLLTVIPLNTTKSKNNFSVLKTYESNSKLSFRSNSSSKRLFSNNDLCNMNGISKKTFELKNYNDEKFFNTSKKNKKFLFPKENYFFKKTRINHDINYFNIRNVMRDYTQIYQQKSYKIKDIVNQDIFVNKIKKDLLKLKFGNRLKFFNNLIAY